MRETPNRTVEPLTVFASVAILFIWLPFSPTLFFAAWHVEAIVDALIVESAVVLLLSLVLRVGVWHLSRSPTRYRSSPRLYLAAKAGLALQVLWFGACFCETLLRSRVLQ